MELAKKNILFIVGVAALILVIIVFSFSMKSVQQNLENGTLKDWNVATEKQRMDTVRLMANGEENLEILTNCVSRMAALPDAGATKVSDAFSLCSLGVALRNE